MEDHLSNQDNKKYTTKKTQDGNKNNFDGDERSSVIKGDGEQDDESL